jgi:hypothetical protein
MVSITVFAGEERDREFVVGVQRDRGHDEVAGLRGFGG